MAIRDQVARHSDYDETKDYIPTPPFATRALYEHVEPALKKSAKRMTAYDPAAGRGHMMSVFREYGHKKVIGSDVTPYPEKSIWERDYLTEKSTFSPDLIITNPPYKHSNKFILQALEEATTGVAMLVRVQALEGQGRYNSLYSKHPPTQIAFFSDRIPFRVGQVVQKAPKMFFHVWLWWSKIEPKPRPPMWIPPTVQRELEKEGDYE